MSVHHDVRIAAGEAHLRGAMRLPAQARGIVVFAHGSGTTRRAAVNRFVARRLARAGFATLLIDLLQEHESHDRVSLRFAPRPWNGLPSGVMMRGPSTFSHPVSGPRGASGTP